jgi:hypothetical protein
VYRRAKSSRPTLGAQYTGALGHYEEIFNVRIIGRSETESVQGFDTPASQFGQSFPGFMVPKLMIARKA